MPARTHGVKVVLFVLCMGLFVLQSGCGSSAGGGQAGTPASSGSDIHLALSTTSGSTAVVADGRSTVPIRIQVTNASGAGMAGVPATFATTAGSLSASPVIRASRDLPGADPTAILRADGDGSVTVTTDANGIAQVILTASTQAQTVLVTADVQGFRTNIVIDFAPGPAARVQLNAPSATVNAAGTATLTATVTDANGNPVSGETVTFSLSTNNSGATLSETSGVTDSNGKATVTYTAGTTPGADTVRAQVTSTSVVGSTSITVADNPNPAAVVSIAAAAGSPTVVADGVSTVAVRATVTVTAGSSPAGILVTFSTTAGSVSPATARTDTNGVASTNLTAAKSLGTATVTASGGGFSASTTVTFVAGAPAAVALSATPLTLSVGATSSLVAAVTDATGNPTSGQTLVFAFTTNATGATLSPLSGVTDDDGRVTVTYTAGTTPGTDTVQARTVNNLTGTVSITVTPLGNANDIDLLVSSPQLPSSGAGNVTLTALLRDTDNNAVSGVLVSFSADSGSVEVVSGTTGPAGTATALLTTGGDPKNRTITVTARTSSLSTTNTVQVTGTTLTISGASTLVLNTTTQLSILLRDSVQTGIPNQAIAVSSQNGNTLSASSVTTDATGQATVRVTATVPGNDIITVSAFLGTLRNTAELSVSPDNFVITTSVPGTGAPLNTPQTVTVHWDKAGVNQAAQPINFFATRGNFALNACAVAGPTTCATTDASGNATVTISADNAGPAVISAVANVSSGPSTQVEIEFIATTVASLEVQASRTTLGVNIPPSTAQQSVITAVARDAAQNLVKNQTVSFSLDDPSGGSIFPASAITDSFGQASTVYTSGAATSANNGVVITAAIGAVMDTVSLTVAQRPLFVVLGTGNVVQTPSPTQYALPYSVLVTDADGNPVGGAVVNLSVLPTSYEKGIYEQFLNAEGNCGWQKQQPTLTCGNEDVNNNGILDRTPPGADCFTATATEDRNCNNRLDPGNVATTSASTVTTDASGFAFFDVVYARQFTWVEVDLVARTVVSGTEGLSSARFFLLGAASDFGDCKVDPPGKISPYGVDTTPLTGCTNSL